MGLLGLISASLAPLSGRLVDRIVPWLGQLIGLCFSFSGMLIALCAAERSVVAVAISVTMFDCGNQLFQVSASYRVAGLDPKARARLNGCVLLCVFAGQVSERVQGFLGSREVVTTPLTPRHPARPSSRGYTMRTAGHPRGAQQSP